MEEKSPDHTETDSDSPKFALPVDSEHKATVFRLFSVAPPHMRAFHLSWISFFCCFVSTFAAPPLLPIIRDNLNLTSTDIGNAGIAAVSGAVFARVAMGTACDLFGPRLASASLILLTTPAVYCSSIANSAASFLLAGGATSAAAQRSSSCPLSSPSFRDAGAVRFTAWRIAFFIPGLMQTLSAFAVFFLGQDLPDGNFSKLKKSGEKHKDNFSQVIQHAVTNYRGWILALTYGFSFGVELTIDNIIAQYFYDRFNVNLHTAGIIAASFGLANLFSRPGGGLISDAVGKRFGMRGRLWTLWMVQTLGGLLCIVLGRVGSLSASIAAMVVFSIFVQAACGLTFGIVPFVSRRLAFCIQLTIGITFSFDGSLGVISGMTGGGGNVGAVLTQVIFFRGSRFKTETGLTLMGVMIVCCTLPVALIYFPQWGGMFCGPSSKGTTEEDYYLSEWSSIEREKGFQRASLKFADNSRSERGTRVGSTSSPADENPPTHV
ncbi:hypothetical protein U1Q18_017104 [Sarracenia purpurea var. burkii]